MRISDWSSDVCSSDLLMRPYVGHGVRLRTCMHPLQGAVGDFRIFGTGLDVAIGASHQRMGEVADGLKLGLIGLFRLGIFAGCGCATIGSTTCRDRVCQAG